MIWATLGADRARCVAVMAPSALASVGEMLLYEAGETLEVVGGGGDGFLIAQSTFSGEAGLVIREWVAWVDCPSLPAARPSLDDGDTSFLPPPLASVFWEPETDAAVLARACAAAVGDAPGELPTPGGIGSVEMPDVEGALPDLTALVMENATDATVDSRQDLAVRSGLLQGATPVTLVTGVAASEEPVMASPPLCHPHILARLGWLASGELVTEPFGLLPALSAMAVADRICLVSTVASALEAIHFGGAVHGRVCLANVVVAPRGGGFRLAALHQPDGIDDGAPPSVASDVAAFGRMAVAAITHDDDGAVSTPSALASAIGEALPAALSEVCPPGAVLQVCKLLGSAVDPNPVQRPTMGLLDDALAVLQHLANSPAGCSWFAAAVAVGRPAVLVLVDPAPDANAIIGSQAAIAVAAGRGRADLVAALIGLGADVNATDDDGTTPLMCGAEAGSASSIELLLAAGAMVDAISFSGETALSVAVAEDNAVAVSLLVAAGSDPAEPLIDGRTMVHIAAQSNSLDALEALSAAGLDLNLPMGSTGRTALHDAALAGHAACVEAFLRHGADPNAVDLEGAVPLHGAVANGHVAVVRCLLLGGADLAVASADGGQRAIHMAAGNGEAEVVGALIEAGADLSARDDDAYQVFFFFCLNVCVLVVLGACCTCIDLCFVRECLDAGAALCGGGRRGCRGRSPAGRRRRRGGGDPRR